MHNDEGMYSTVITIMHRMENVKFVCELVNVSSIREKIC
jgi:hypothetical protein